MRSLSRVIKSSQMLLTSPVVIDSLESEEIEIMVGDISEIGVPDELELEKQELENVKKESTLILQETEAMVLELLDKARTEARDILVSAQEEGEMLRLAARKEAEEIRAQAKADGYEEGLRTAQQEIESDRQAAFQQSRELLEEAHHTKIKMFEECEADIIRMIMAIAKKVIATELSLNPNIIAGVIREAINFLDQPENLTVYVNPTDLEKVLEIMNLEISGYNGDSPRMRPDESVSNGGCILESEAGTVDARMETRIEGVQTALMEVIDNE
mgnify:CR=1 FL=1